MTISPRVFLAVALLSAPALAQSTPQSETKGRCDLKNPPFAVIIDWLITGEKLELSEDLQKAEEGRADPQYRMGWRYECGIDVPRDYAEAVKWYRRAAEQGSVSALLTLADLYYEGSGVRQDYSEAEKWYRRSAEQGSAIGQHNLGLLYYQGRGVPQDYAEAVKWYRKAAEQGDNLAQTKLGIAYYEGRGVPQDYVQAHMWANLAAADSTGEEQKSYAMLRDEIAAKMTPEQLAEAQRLAREWKPIPAK